VTDSRGCRCAGTRRAGAGVASRSSWVTATVVVRSSHPTSSSSLSLSSSLIGGGDGGLGRMTMLFALRSAVSLATTAVMPTTMSTSSPPSAYDDGSGRREGSDDGNDDHGRCRGGAGRNSADAEEEVAAGNWCSVVCRFCR